MNINFGLWQSKNINLMDNLAKKKLS